MYESCDPVPDPCEKCGQAGGYQRVALFPADAPASIKEATVVCLNCVVSMYGTLKNSMSDKMLDELLYEGQVIDKYLTENEAGITVQTPYGLVTVGYDPSVTTEQIRDPGGGVNSAGAPRPTKSATSLTMDTGTVSIVEPREERTPLTTSYHNGRFDTSDL